MDDRSTRAAVNALVATEPSVKPPLAAPAVRPAIGATRGMGVPIKAPAGTGGISSPITAESVTSESRTITSSDGLFSLTYDHWLVLTCHDAESREVVIDLSALA